MPIAVDTIKQQQGSNEEPDSTHQLIEGLKKSQSMQEGIDQMAGSMFGLDEYTNLETLSGDFATAMVCEYAPMLLDEYTGNGEETADMSFFGLPSPTSQIPAVQIAEETPAVASAPELSSEAPCDSKPIRAMTSDEMSSLLAFFQEAPDRATQNLRNKRVGDLRGASAKHILKTTGQAIHCVIWEGRHYISSYDIIKVLKVLVIDDGQGNMYDQDIDIESKKFEENVFSVLRQLKVGVNCQLEEARSDFLDWLVRHDCIRTQKKQKVFYWHDVNVAVMAKEIRNRCLRNGIPTKSILVGQRTADCGESNPSSPPTGQHQPQNYPAGAKLPIQPQHKKPRVDAAVLYPSIQPQGYPYMMPYGVPTQMAPPQRIQQMAQAYQAYQIQLQQHMQMQQQQQVQTEQYYQPQPQQFVQQEFSTSPYQDMLISPQQQQQQQQQCSDDFYMNYLNVPQSPVENSNQSTSPSNSMQNDPSPVMSYIEPQVLDMSNYPFAQYQPSNSTIPPSYYDESAYYYTPANTRQAPSSPVNERKHVCNICGRGFKRNEHLKRHEFTHTGEKRHSCKYCNKLFARSDNLQQHLKQTHKKEWEDEEEQRRRTPRGANSPTQGINGSSHGSHGAHQGMGQMGMFDQRPSALVQEPTSLTNNANDLDAMLNFHFASSLVDLDRLNL